MSDEEWNPDAEAANLGIRVEQYIYAYYRFIGKSKAFSIRQAWPKKTEGWPDHKCNRHAAGTERSKGVQKALQTMRQDFREYSNESPEQIMQKWIDMREQSISMAEDSGKGSDLTPAIKAHEAISKMHGLLSERHIIRREDMTEAEIEKKLRAMAEANPDIKALIVDAVEVTPIPALPLDTESAPVLEEVRDVEPKQIDQ